LRGAVAFLALACAVSPAHSADRRVPVDPNEPPWNAVAKVQTNIGMHCSGALIAPAVVVTAAHCLYNPRTHAFLLPLSVHVLLGYERGSYRWHRLVTRIVLGTPVAGEPWRRETDWARLELAEPVATSPLPLASSVAEGSAVELAGYNQDYAQVLMADLDCRVLQVTDAANGAMIVSHNCSATWGTSGAPLLTRRDGGWVIVGINVAAGPSSNFAVNAGFGN
jgi:protease YdgD